MSQMVHRFTVIVDDCPMMTDCVRGFRDEAFASRMVETYRAINPTGQISVEWDSTPLSTYRGQWIVRAIMVGQANCIREMASILQRAYVEAMGDDWADGDVN